jgi:catechol 2,3-dioxygenase-like lactoylglutathione lyase family enzyme
VSNTFHLSLDVPDLGVAVSFYRELLGAEPAKEKPGYAKFELTDPPLALALQQSSRAALSHLGIRVETTSEVESAAARLRDSGLVTLEERETACCYALQDKVWVADPAGNRWEVYTVIEDVDENDESPTPVEDGVPCCSGGCCAA